MDNPLVISSIVLSVSGGMASGVTGRILATVQCSESMPSACAESFSLKTVPIVLGNESS